MTQTSKTPRDREISEGGGADDEASDTSKVAIPAGFATFPLWGMTDGRCDCGKPDCEAICKHPAFPYSTLQKGQVVEGREGMGSAVATGLRSGVFVVDFDDLDVFEQYPDCPIRMRSRRPGVCTSTTRTRASL